MVLCLLVPKPKQEWEEIDYISFESKMPYIKQHALNVLDDLRSSKNDRAAEDGGYLSRLTTKIIDNI